MTGDRAVVKHTDGKKGNGKGKGDDRRKVQALRNAVKDGKYTVEPRKVAEKIIKDALQEIRSRGR